MDGNTSSLSNILAYLFQAKRMKMIDHFGVKVADKSIEKNWRAVHRYEEHGAAIFDLSYYIAL